MIQTFFISIHVSNKFIKPPYKEMARTLLTKDSCGGGVFQMGTKCNLIGILKAGKWDKMHDISKRVYSDDGLSPTIHCCGGGNLEPKVMINSLNTCSCNQGVLTPIAYDEQNGYLRSDGLIGTLTTDGSSPKHNNRILISSSIRKLTPKECWRLMDFDDVDFFRAAYGKDIPIEFAVRIEKRNLQKCEWKFLWRYMRKQQTSNSQLYKQAGNSIVVSVLEQIFKQML